MKDMQAQLEKEGEEDQSVYEKVTCWCEKSASNTAENETAKNL